MYFYLLILLPTRGWENDLRTQNEGVDKTITIFTYFELPHSAWSLGLPTARTSGGDLHFLKEGEGKTFLILVPQARKERFGL